MLLLLGQCAAQSLPPSLPPLLLCFQGQEGVLLGVQGVQGGGGQGHQGGGQGHQGHSAQLSGLR